MAYVRRTETLVADVKRRVREMRQAAVSQHSSDTIEVGTPLYGAFRRSIEAASWDAAPELKDKLPNDWLITPSGNRVTAYIAHDFVIGGTASDQQIWLDAPEHNPWKLPPDQNQGSYRYEVKVKRCHQEQEVKDWSASEVNRSTKRSEVTAKFQKVETQLEAFMGQHASLNAAIKEMPAIELYVPDEYMRRIKAKTPPRVKTGPSTAAVDLGIDVDALTTAGIAHRITKQSAA